MYRLITSITILFSAVQEIKAQDLITFKDGKEAEAMVLEVSDKEVVYNEWEDLDGPVNIIPKSDLRSIQYKNGKKLTFEEEKVNIFSYVDKMPEPSVNVLKYLRDNLRYPLAAKENGVQGRVVVKFYIDEFGNSHDIKAVNNPLGYGLEEEAIRIIRKLPPWKPGMQDGKPVKVWFNQTINFRLEVHY